MEGRREQKNELIELQGAVNKDGKPFVIVLTDGKQTGQLTPREAMRFGTRAIQAGIEAERDSAVVDAIHETGGSDEDIARMLTMIREHRTQIDPDPERDYRGPSRREETPDE